MNKIPDLYLVIIGDGPMRNELNDYVKELNILSKVKFLGKKTNIDFWYNVADVFVSSSEREGFGLVVAEAMACERIVVATNCGIVNVIDKNLVFTVEPRNSDLLSKAIISSLLIDKRTKRIIQEKSLKFVKQHFSIDEIVLAWLQTYNSKKRS